MSEPSKENERLAERLNSIAAALKPPPAKANGGAVYPVSAQDEALAAWAKQYAGSEEGKRVSALVNLRLRPFDGALTEHHLDPIFEAIAKGAAELMDRKLEPLKARLDALEKKKGLAPLAARLAQVESEALRDGDVWREGANYRKNALVTHNGHLWIARRETNTRPPGDDWRMMHHNNKVHK